MLIFFGSTLTTVETGTSDNSPASNSKSGWFSAAANYRKIGMKADARRCLSNIVRRYPDSEWARRAREELRKL